MHHVYAHRGSSAAYAENTRAAYLQAIADGADGIECDVHLTRDDRIVCHHDQTVDRTSNASGRISSFTLQELRELDFASWKGREIPAAYGGLHDQLLTLGELVDLAATAGRSIGLAIEIKHPSEFGRGLEDAVLEELTALGWEATTSRIGDVTVSFMCFDAGSVRHLGRRVPAEVLCQLVTGENQKKVAGLAERGDELGARVAAVVYGSAREGVPAIEVGIAGLAGPGVAWVRRHEDTVRGWLDAGTGLRVWTVDEEADIRFLARLGVQEMTSNDPKHTRAVLDSLARA
ncbi:MAG: glycerophosphodiester phosphodiesterase family protein [Arthrobacter sp.]|uniref:glycerophosphodiester phosphodiesterase family protein n=1 Tax=Arthrobacter sp. 179 TaxID=3457734 RepID=UPI00264C81EF|nr:glycerophosphodiester phosphodiesterase [Micrococcaceae bacterium]MDN5811850.1 glycerophosphodiester phosphodiesterase [Micrococcaceae bacterium]MDN5905988.1 glycerophosphodiester phosphodiesterase [Micrococcaceae bacterium]MDN6169429.1 glycerophosphodiester phosphodiesterase [Micrococcaceae bacterium]